MIINRNKYKNKLAFRALTVYIYILLPILGFCQCLISITSTCLQCRGEKCQLTLLVAQVEEDGNQEGKGDDKSTHPKSMAISGT